MENFFQNLRTLQCGQDRGFGAKVGGFGAKIGPSEVKTGALVFFKSNSHKGVSRQMKSLRVDWTPSKKCFFTNVTRGGYFEALAGAPKDLQYS